jgi:hypothetical protein
MQKTIGMLAVLLAAQLLLAVGMSFTGPNLAAHRQDAPLLALDDGAVDRLVIEDADKTQIVLARQGDGWVLPATGNFPADRHKVEQLIERLKGLQRGLAVATTPGAQKRFKVSDDDFERRVTLARGDKNLATLYLGTSPGMHRVHARTDQDSAVYAVEFANYEAPVKPADWEDKTVLRVPRDDIDKITVADLTLTRQPKKAASAAPDKGAAGSGRTTWTGTNLADGEKLNQANADNLAQQLSDLLVGSVLGTKQKPGYGLEKPALVFGVQRTDGTTVEYRLGKREADNDYVIKASSRPEYFRLPGFTGDALIKAGTRTQLVAAPGATDTAATAGAAVATAPPTGEGGPDQTAADSVRVP